MQINNNLSKEKKYVSNNNHTLINKGRVTLQFQLNKVKLKLSDIKD